MEGLMELEASASSNSVSDLVILEIMDTIEEIIDTEPERPFSFGLAAATGQEPVAPGVTRKILYIGKSALETLKVLSSLHRSYNIRKNFKNLGLKDLAKIGTQGAAVALYLMAN
jgi:hypothetical protein